MKYLISAIRRNAIKSGTLIGPGMAIFAIFSVFRNNVPKDGKKVSLKKDSQKSGDNLD